MNYSKDIESDSNILIVAEEETERQANINVEKQNNCDKVYNNKASTSKCIAPKNSYSSGSNYVNM